MSFLKNFSISKKNLSLNKNFYTKTKVLCCPDDEVIKFKKFTLSTKNFINKSVIKDNQLSFNSNTKLNTFPRVVVPGLLKSLFLSNSQKKGYINSTIRNG